MPTTDVSFSSEAPEELQKYRPLSRWSLIAALVALLSPLSLVHPLLTFVPALAVLLALIALRTITTFQVGKVLAYLALIPAVVFVALGPTRYFTRYQKLHSDGRQFASDWLEIILARQIFEAHQLTLPYFDRQSSDVSLDEYYANPFVDIPGLATEASMHAPFTDLEDFKAQNPLKEVLRWPDGFNYEYQRSIPSRSPTNDTEAVGLIYKLTNLRGDKSVLMAIVLQRYLQAGSGYWRVLEIYDPDFVMPTLRKSSNVPRS